MVIALKQIVFKSIIVAVIMQNKSTQTSISHQLNQRDKLKCPYQFLHLILMHPKLTDIYLF